jgi:hypothetical protein
MLAEAGGLDGFFIARLGRQSRSSTCRLPQPWLRCLPNPSPSPNHEPDPLPATVEQYEDDGPDLSWMMPKERRELHFGEASQSSLRARLVQNPPEPEPELPPSLWGRLRAWLRGLAG